jgi:hypothetical protein
MREIASIRPIQPQEKLTGFRLLIDKMLLHYGAVVPISVQVTTPMFEIMLRQ